MDLLSVLSTSRESMVSHGSALSTIADNLANSNTPGFKGQRAEFGDLISDSLGGLYSAPESSGAGVAVDNVQALHTQGALEYTYNQTDLAINGQGFFVLSDGSSNCYTRAGNFEINEDGVLVSQDGKQVLGYTANSPDNLTALTVGGTTLDASATTSVDMGGNLNNSSPISAAPGGSINSFSALNSASAYSTTVEAVDSLGQRHDVLLHFFHTAQSEWTVEAYVDGKETGAAESAPQLLSSSVLTFDEFGQQVEGAGIFKINPAWSNGASAGDISIDLNSFTGFASSSGLTSIISDGIRSGSITGFTVENDGTLVASMDNGETTNIGRVALATFANPTALDRIGSNQFVESTKSSDPSIGHANIEGRGSLSNNSLETSNIDASREFTDIIRYQRGYQGSSQAFQTANELINTTLQLA